MTEKSFDNGATGALAIILPLAVVIVVLLKAWPFLLLLLALIIGVKVWQSYQWRKWSQQINPFFTELLKESQGCVTPLELSLKANMTAKAAYRYLDKKAEEYGAQRKILANKGVVYYFLTASTLGSIFEDSEPLLELDEFSEEEIVSPSSPPPSKDKEKPSPEVIAPLAEPEESPTSTSVASKTRETLLQEEQTHVSEVPSAETETPPPPKTAHLELIQSELAKRLDVNPSTVGRRKSDPDFTEWSQSKDPEGTAWKYIPKTKMFIPLEQD